MPQRAWLVALCLFAAACDSSPTNATVPNYAGNWSGSYGITKCTETGDVAGAQLCSAVPGTASFTMTLAQSGTSPGSTLSGSFSLGAIPFSIAPTTIAQSGAVTFTGTTIESGVTVVATWSLSSPLVGSVSEIFTVTGVSGQVTIAGTISNAVKTTAAVRVPTPLQPSAMRTLQDVQRAVFGALQPQ